MKVARVERSLGWYSRDRCLSKDYEHPCEVSETMAYIASIQVSQYSKQAYYRNPIHYSRITIQFTNSECTHLSPSPLPRGRYFPLCAPVRFPALSHPFHHIGYKPTARSDRVVAPTAARSRPSTPGLRLPTPLQQNPFCWGHALIRNLGRGYSALAAGVPARLRLATAWTVLAAAL